MVKLEEGKSVGIRDLETFQDISETYLSKVYTKLSKSGIIKSIPGVKGGDALALRAEEIAFWDIGESVEGSKSFFQCAKIRQNNILLDKDNLPDILTKCPCLIKVVMSEAEDEMGKYLRKKSLAWLYNEVYNKNLPKEVEKATIEWFNNSRK
ncbi:Rrf2 family transcriptional regulator [Clostridium beijerinckii]|uniref:Rrf2 family transcriptional regulator n=1 Tax=Clostridium beijerinckii TaxID=1520 RepID=UPI0017987921|nr:Rrf2 family transcriptional regulator [Clostridium beijerinckii]NOW05157.1 Rrf2 family protein [Clostridium beijerinckii]NYC01701.1 Rrf2 family protein [Clostridium beijerinckii]